MIAIKQAQESPLVSVIIPNYNHAKYLDQRLKSILNQSYSNIEVIILDDCSTDNSIEVIDKYKYDTRIKSILVNEHNSGNTFLQWDKGLRVSNGDLIWIAESDDYCELNLLQELITAYTHRKNTVLAYSTLTLVDECGNVTCDVRHSANQYFSSSQYLRRYLSLANFVRNASCAVFSRSAALKVSADYLKYSSAGDYLFWIEIASQGRVAVVNKGISYFRRHSGVITERRDADGTNFTAEKEILNKLFSMVKILYLRKIYIYSYHCRRVLNTQYDSDIIRDNLYSLWEIKKYSGIISRSIMKVTDAIRYRFNMYL